MSNTIKITIFLFLSLSTVLFVGCKNKTNANNLAINTEAKALKKILFVVTSHSEKGDTGEKTGYYLGKVSHPWDVLHAAGYEIDFVSPKGGKAPVDAFDMSDSINKKFWDNDVYRNKIENTKTPNEVNPEDYVAIHYAGGHGAMWDFADNTEIAEIARQIYENNGVVSAVCHGPAGLVNIKLSNGSYLVAGKKVNAFTNEEEVKVKLIDIVPFLLEDKLRERGAIFEKAAPFNNHVVTDQRLVTGQNPQSAKSVGIATLKVLQTLSENTK
ncbi:MAG: type 1 glutamine amidotransferase domain-containing protein [Oceanihabitans sp.]|nr:type 1 glutamine amidotransferase domain-containing protein [Oceanihabitans sp.]